MTESSRPWNSTLIGDAGPYSAEQWQEVWRNLAGSILDSDATVLPNSGSAGITPLKVRQGSVANNTVRVAPGAAIVRGIFYVNDAEEVFTIPANVSGNARIDRIVLEADFATQTVRLDHLTGTPAGSPTAPALTQIAGTIWQMPLATIAVANGFLTILDSHITNTIYSFRSSVVDPPGVIKAYAGAAAPTGYLLCHGQSLDPTVYPALFAAIGTTFGGDGVTTFSIPDLRGRTIIGKDNMGGSSANRVTDAAADSIGGAGGAETHTLTIAQMPAHQHTYSRLNSTPGSGSIGGGTGWTGQSDFTGVQGSTTAHNNMQPYMTMNFIISI